MTLTAWIAITALAAVIVLATQQIERTADRREPEPPDRGVNPFGPPPPSRMIVPRRHRPRMGGSGLHRFTVRLGNGEQYILVFPARANPLDVMRAAQAWGDEPTLSFCNECENAVLDLLVRRDSMME